MTWMDDIQEHPLVQETKRNLVESLSPPENPHSHSRILPDKTIETLECNGPVVDERHNPKLITEWEADSLCLKIVASKQYRCLKPSIPDDDGILIRYAAAKLSELALDSYKC